MADAPDVFEFKDAKDVFLGHKALIAGMALVEGVLYTGAQDGRIIAFNARDREKVDEARSKDPISDCACACVRFPYSLSRLCLCSAGVRRCFAFVLTCRSVCSFCFVLFFCFFRSQWCTTAEMFMLQLARVYSWCDVARVNWRHSRPTASIQ